MFKWNDGTELYHHGIKGQKWGIRRFQNEDGSLTAAGRERYGVEGKSENSTSSFDPSNARGKASKPHGYQAPAKQPYRPHSRKVYKQLGGALPFKKGEEVDTGYYPLSGYDYMQEDAENWKELMNYKDYEEALNMMKEMMKSGEWAEVKNRYGISKEEWEAYAKEFTQAAYLEDDWDKAKKIDEKFGKLIKSREKQLKKVDAHAAKPWSDNKKKAKGVEYSYEKK